MKGSIKLKKDQIPKNNLLLVDWLTFSTCIWSESDLIDMLQLHGVAWKEKDGFRYGYRHLKTYGGMTILSDGHQENMGICVEFSGQGCRSFESFSRLGWTQLFYLLMNEYNEFRVSRLDLAFDDHTGILDLDLLLDDTDEHLYRSRSKWWKVEYGSTGTTIYHGSPQSKIRCRIYDKAYSSEICLSDNCIVRLLSSFSGCVSGRKFYDHRYLRRYQADLGGIHCKMLISV